ncbi:extracellular solute-binding protein [Salsipaludibacter albus]|uniref:extracellular solute-binding protein n=1 Tax=Salsipaludibacter albus TaxID=2849650 RepID=UPI001EE4A20E|nr:extracellular solute-binding protein [Salsipaludibacter albus]MBY5164259.1 extracellular solute-binding protein [Salsipaludibacter albus]
MKHRKTRTLRMMVVAAVVALAVASCGSDASPDDTSSDAGSDTSTEAATDAATSDAATSEGAEETAAESGEPVEIDWWHIQNNDPGLADWQAMADAFMAENPNVTINITPMENEAFKAALQTNLQSGDVPDLFQSWGGGSLRQQVEAGLVRDITDLSSGWIDQLSPATTGIHQVDGVQYGIPYNAGVFGFWYNQDLWTEAGLDAPADTWEGLLEQVQTIKDAGITPIAVGAGDKWPAHFYYGYLMIRAGGEEAMNALAETSDFTADNVITAGEEVLRLVELEPFQDGFLGAGWDAPDGESGTMARGDAAMDLMGQWAPGAFKTQAGVEPTDDLPFELKWAPFPTLEGGAGAPGEVFGGVDGFVVGKDAPDEAVDFLEFLTNEENQETWATSSGLPVNPDAVDVIEDPQMQQVLEALNGADFLQIALDQYFSPEVGAAINDQTALLFAQETTPEEAGQAITQVAGG